MGSLRSDRVVVGGEVRPASIRWSEGVIVEIADSPAELDLGDLVVMPGLVDSHVHVNEPGRTEWEGFRTATRAAAAGGTTTIVDMPLNCIPPTVDVAALEAKRRAASGKLNVDVAFWAGIIPGSREQIRPLVEAGVCGFKAFLVDSGVEEFPPVGLEALGEALPALRSLGVPSLVHAEDPLQIRPVEGDPRRYPGYLASRPPRAEADAIAGLAGLAGATGASIHVLHVSSAEAVRELASTPGSVSGETCPHYLLFDAAGIPDGATLFKCAPPIRSAEHREALWQGLVEGVLSMVVSDHSPAPPQLKALDTGDFARAWGGIGSLQLRLPATWTGAEPRGVSLPALSAWLSTVPAGLAGLTGKGSIEPGMDADLVAWDPDGVTLVEPQRLHHRHPITPYAGLELRGSVELTMLRGDVVFTGGALVEGLGRMLNRG